MAVRCTVELQLADGSTGRNLSTMVYPRAMVRAFDCIINAQHKPALHRSN